MSSITLVLFLVIGLLLGSVSMIGTGKGTEALLLSRSFFWSLVFSSSSSLAKTGGALFKGSKYAVLRLDEGTIA